MHQIMYNFKVIETWEAEFDLSYEFRIFLTLC